MNKTDRLRDDVKRLHEELRHAQLLLSFHEQPEAETLALAGVPAAFAELLDQSGDLLWSPEGFQRIWCVFESVCLRAGLDSIVRNGARDEIPPPQIGSARGPAGWVYLQHADSAERGVYVTVGLA